MPFWRKRQESTPDATQNEFDDGLSGFGEETNVYKDPRAPQVRVPARGELPDDLEATQRAAAALLLKKEDEDPFADAFANYDEDDDQSYSTMDSSDTDNKKPLFDEGAYSVALSEDASYISQEKQAWQLNKASDFMSGFGQALEAVAERDDDDMQDVEHESTENEPNEISRESSAQAKKLGNFFSETMEPSPTDPFSQIDNWSQFDESTVGGAPSIDEAGAARRMAQLFGDSVSVVSSTSTTVDKEQAIGMMEVFGETKSAVPGVPKNLSTNLVSSTRSATAIDKEKAIGKMKELFGETKSAVPGARKDLSKFLLPESPSSDDPLDNWSQMDESKSRGENTRTKSWKISCGDEEENQGQLFVLASKGSTSMHEHTSASASVASESSAPTNDTSNPARSSLLQACPSSTDCELLDSSYEGQHDQLIDNLGSGSVDYQTDRTSEEDMPNFLPPCETCRERMEDKSASEPTEDQSIVLMIERPAYLGGESTETHLDGQSCSEATEDQSIVSIIERAPYLQDESNETQLVDTSASEPTDQSFVSMVEHTQYFGETHVEDTSYSDPTDDQSIVSMPEEPLLLDDHQSCKGIPDTDVCEPTGDHSIESNGEQPLCLSDEERSEDHSVSNASAEDQSVVSMEDEDGLILDRCVAEPMEDHSRIEEPLLVSQLTAQEAIENKSVLEPKDENKCLDSTLQNQVLETEGVSESKTQETHENQIHADDTVRNSVGQGPEGSQIMFVSDEVQPDPITSDANSRDECDESTNEIVKRTGKSTTEGDWHGHEFDLSLDDDEEIFSTGRVRQHDCHDSEKVDEKEPVSVAGGDTDGEAGEIYSSITPCHATLATSTGNESDIHGRMSLTHFQADSDPLQPSKSETVQPIINADEVSPLDALLSKEAPQSFEEAFDDMSLIDSSVVSGPNTVSSASVKDTRMTKADAVNRLAKAGFGDLFEESKEDKIPNCEPVVEADETEDDDGSITDARDAADTEKDSLVVNIDGEISSLVDEPTTGTIPTTELSVVSGPVANCASFDDGDDSVSSSESENGEDDEDDPFMVIVKDMPLLRLENVTAQTRSVIPEEAKRKKGWGWLGKGARKKDSVKHPLVVQNSTQVNMSESLALEEKVVAPDPPEDSLRIPVDPPPSAHAPKPDNEESKSSDIPSSPVKSPMKKKKKKGKGKLKKGELSNHFSNVKARTVGRHGDEVSVGTTTIQKNAGPMITMNAQAVEVDDQNPSSGDSHPWENVLKATISPPKNETASGEAKMSELGVFGSIDEDDRLDETKNQPTATLDTEECSDCVEMAPENVDSSRSAKGLHETSPHALEELDDLDELNALSALESKLVADADEVDFDNMWDTVSCDASVAKAFSHRQAGKKLKSKQKKKRSNKKTAKINAVNLEDEQVSAKHREEQYHDSDSDDVERIQLFETSADGLRSKLSTDFVNAMHSVFDEQTLAPNDEPEAKDELKSRLPVLTRSGSEKSLFTSVGIDPPGKIPENEEPAASESDDSESDDDESIYDAYNRTRRHKRRTAQSVKSKSSASSFSSRKSCRSKKTLDPTEAFEEEMNRAQAGKLLSISALRQEMASNRGATVNYVHREYEKYQESKFGDRDANNTSVSFEAQFDEALIYSQSKLSFISEEVKNDTFSDDASGVTGALGGLESHIARWGQKEKAIPLDDLMTVQNTVLESESTCDESTCDDENHSPWAAKSKSKSIADLPLLSPKLGFSKTKSPKRSSPTPNAHLKPLSDIKATEIVFPASFQDAVPLTTITETFDDDNEQLVKGLDDFDDDETISTRKSSGSARILSPFKKMSKLRNKIKMPQFHRRGSLRNMESLDDDGGLIHPY